MANHLVLSECTLWSYDFLFIFQKLIYLHLFLMISRSAYLLSFLLLDNKLTSVRIICWIFISIPHNSTLILVINYSIFSMVPTSTVVWYKQIIHSLDWVILWSVGLLLLMAWERRFIVWNHKVLLLCSHSVIVRRWRFLWRHFDLNAVILISN